MDCLCCLLPPSTPHLPLPTPPNPPSPVTPPNPPSPNPPSPHPTLPHPTQPSLTPHPQLSHRVSLIQPGGVITEMITSFSVEEHTEEYDDVMKPMLMGMLAPKADSIFTKMQTADEIAQLTKDVIESDSPHLRYQSSEGVAQIAGCKWKDPTGDSSLNRI